MNRLKVEKTLLIGSYYDDIRYWSDMIQHIINKHYCGDLSDISDSDKETINDYESKINETLKSIDKVKKEIQWEL